MTDLRIGFVGLGLMGSAMTTRLVEAGFAVTGYDLDPAKVAAAEANGIAAAASPAAVTEASDLVLVCVTATSAVEAVVFGEGGVAEAGAPRKTLIDFSTSEVSATRDMADRLQAICSMGWVDAPVSGGPGAATTGSLAIMMGGSDADVARVAPVMEALAATHTHFGPVGAGQTAKMVNQVLVLNGFPILAEALALAEAGGIDAAKIPEALGAGYAGSNLLQAMFGRLLARDFAPAGYARQVLKDLDMVQDLARSLKTPTPMSAQSATLYRILISKGYSELDAIAVLKLYDGEERL